MQLTEPYASRLREALAEHRRAAVDAEQVADIEAMRAALDRCWTARMTIWTAMTDGERATRRAALANLGEAA